MQKRLFTYLIFFVDHVKLISLLCLHNVNNSKNLRLFLNFNKIPRKNAGLDIINMALKIYKTYRLLRQ